jgi:hypothetical protein
MMNTTTGNTLRLTLAALFCCGLVACGDPPTPPEEAIRAWVAEGQRLAEEKDRNGMMDLISPAYADSRGNERGDIENMLRIYFLRQNSIQLLTKIGDILVFGDDAAELDLTIGMAATNDGTFRFSADAYNFKMELVRDGNDWLLVSAQWGEVGHEIR